MRAGMRSRAASRPCGHEQASTTTTVRPTSGSCKRSDELEERLGHGGDYITLMPAASWQTMKNTMLMRLLRPGRG